MKNLKVNLGEDSYNIFIGKGLLNNVNEYIEEICRSNKICIITDNNVLNLYAHNLKDTLTRVGYVVEIFVFKHGEESKNLDTCKDAYDKLIEMKFSRSDLIIALGGGVVGDLAGFVASTYLRGVRFVQIPTSLLAQVDSSVGGKVAVDLPQGKNLVGSFYQPKLVLIDTDCLYTLTDRFFNDGLGEVIKYSMIKDKELFHKLNSFNSKEELLNNIDDIIYNCCDIKRSVVENDEHDTGLRMILNFGHTLGHAIEKIYGFNTISHGEGVCIGMNMITQLSEKKGLTNKDTANSIKDILIRYNLPYEINLDDKNQILDAISVDKKNLDGNLNLILLQDIGQCYIYKSNINFFSEIF